MYIDLKKKSNHKNAVLGCYFTADDHFHIS